MSTVENKTIIGSGEDNNTEWAELIFLAGGDGNDVIYNVKSTSQSTIRGGGGNDTIYLEDGNGSYTTYINYASSDGDDVIYGYNASYKINITDGTSYSTVDSGNDIIIKIGNGQIKLANYTGSDNMAYAGRLINFDYNAIYDDEKSNIRIRGTSGNDFIWVGGVNNTIYGGDGNDLPENNDSGNYFILGNGNNDMLNNGDSATIVTGDGNNRIGNNKSYARVTTGGGNDTIENHSGSDNYFDAGGGDDFLDIIAPSRESSLSGDNLTVKGGDGNDTVASWGGWSDGNVISNNLYDGGNGNDYLGIANAQLSTIIGGAGDDTISLFNDAKSNLIQYAAGDGNDIIEGFSSSDTFQVTSGSIIDSVFSGNDLILTISDSDSIGTVTFTDVKGQDIVLEPVYTDELMMFDSDKDSIKLSNEYRSVDASNRTIAVQITGNSKANTIQGGKGRDTISGGSGNDSLVGNAGHDILNGDGGNDTLNGGKGNDTLTGGAGKDVFVISGGAGNDVITDYTSGEDKVKISGGILKSITTSSKDYVLNFTSGKVTLKNAKGKAINYIDALGKTFTTIVGGTYVTLGSSDSSVYTAKKDTIAISAKKRTSAIKITGNTKDNIIYGGTKHDSIYGGNGNDSINGGSGNDKLFGQAGNDTLLGGAGNDTLTGGKGDDILTGGAGSDVFSYVTGDGNDTITDYAANDQIRITGTYTKTNKGGNTIINVGSGSITVLNTTAKNLNISAKSANYEELLNVELSSIIDSDSNLIGEDYNYDFNSTLTKQLNQSLVTNSTKQK